MDYNILTISANENDCTIQQAKSILNAVGNRYTKNFVFTDLVSAEITPEIIKSAKSAHALLLGNGISKYFIRSLCKELNLHSLIRRAGGYTLVSDTLSGIYFGEKGYRTNPAFGREAYDTECYSELEIERTARAAYELPEIRQITLADKADELASSKLWRKTVTDINEDYPYVSVNMQTVEKTAAQICDDAEQSRTILTSNMFADILYSVMEEKSSGAKYAAYIGDTTLGMYGAYPNMSHPESETDIASAICFMLRHSFDMNGEANCLEQAISYMLSESNGLCNLSDIIQNM